MPRPCRMLPFWLLVLATACITVAVPSDAPSATPPGPLDVQAPLDGLPYDDARLRPVIAQLRANPEWLDAPLKPEPSVLALIPSTSELCLALRGTRGDVHVTIDPSRPWSVAAVAIDRGDTGREFTFDPDGLASDVCTFVAFGRGDQWPESAAAIDVTGSVDREIAAAVAEAVYARPERFGIEAVGVPAVLVGDRIEPPPEGWTCSHAVVFVGGPRARIVLGTRPAGSGWDVETRVVEQALVAPEPRRQGQC